MGHPAFVASVAKTVVRFARLFRPTYAGANVGHPSSSYGFYFELVLFDCCRSSRRE
jgi:hypothetical protein